MSLCEGSGYFQTQQLGSVFFIRFKLYRFFPDLGRSWGQIQLGASAGIANARGEAVSSTRQCRRWMKPHTCWLWRVSQGGNPTHFISWTCTTQFYTPVLLVLCTPTAGIHACMQSIDFKPTVGLLIGKHPCFDALNNKVSFHTHHHNVLSTEKGLLAVPKFEPFLPCPSCADVHSEFWIFFLLKSYCSHDFWRKVLVCTQHLPNVFFLYLIQMFAF